MQDAIDRLADPDAEVRAAARMTLVAAGSDSIQALGAVLGAGDDTAARREAAVALGEIGDAAAVPVLLAAFEQPYEVSSWAMRAVGGLGDHQATAPLLARLGDEEFRNVVAQALADLGDAAAVAPLGEELDRLLDRFDYGAYLGRYWTARALVLLGDRADRTIATLEEVIDRDFGPETQQTWGSFRDDAVDLLLAARPERADVFLRPFLKRERETLQLRYKIARHYWLAGEQADLAIRGVIDRMSRHPLYPALSGEAAALLATVN